MQNMKNKIKTIFRTLKGEPHDYTQGPISEAVILLAIPMILELSLESVFAVVDMFFVSRLGAKAITTVGLTESTITLVYSIAIGMSSAVTALVARRTGEKKLNEAAHTAAQSIFLSLIISIFISFFGVIYATDILKFMGASPDVIAEGHTFTEIMYGGNIVILLLFLINGIFRGAGDAAMAMKSLWIASGLNIVLCPILIHFFGVKGAAMATVLARGVGVLYQCYHLFWGKHLLRLKTSYFKLDSVVIKSIFKLSLPASIQFIIGSGSWIVLTRLVAETGGTEASAGYQIAFRNFVFFILPAWGLSNAAATLVGQNIGAKQTHRAEESVLTTSKYSVVLMSLVTLFFLIFANYLIRIFTTDAVVISYGVQALKIIGTGYIFYGLGMILTQAFNGAGDTKTPTWINFVCYWLIQTPVAYFLAKHTVLGVKGAVIAIPVANAVMALTAYIIFKKGKWKSIKI